MLKSMIIANILIFLFVCFTYNVKSQIYYNGTTHTTDLGCNGHYYGGIDFTNDKTYPMILNWTKLLEDTVPGSKFYMCANSDCYNTVPITGSNSAYPVQAGANGFFYMHYWSGNVSGTSTLKIYLYSDLYPNDGDTITYIMNIDCITDIDEYNSANDNISVYPNPSQGFFSIYLKETTNASISLINSLGHILSATEYNFTNKIDMDIDVPKGIYFLQIKAFGEITTRKIVIE